LDFRETGCEECGERRVARNRVQLRASALAVLLPGSQLASFCSHTDCKDGMWMELVLNHVQRSMLVLAMFTSDSAFKE
jgi:hypothetical protein